MTDDEIITALNLAAREAPAASDNHWVGVPVAYKVVTSEQLALAHQELGFRLPELLQRVFLEVGNGGRGIPPGLMGIACAHEPLRNVATEERRGAFDDCVAFYLEAAPGDVAFWPERMVLFVNWGCSMWSGVLCNGSNAVYFFDGNVDLRSPTDPDGAKAGDLSGACWMKEADTLTEWFTRVVKGDPVGHELRDWRAGGHEGPR